MVTISPCPLAVASPRDHDAEPGGDDINDRLGFVRLQAHLQPDVCGPNPLSHFPRAIKLGGRMSGSSANSRKVTAPLAEQIMMWRTGRH